MKPLFVGLLDIQKNLRSSEVLQVQQEQAVPEDPLLPRCA